MKRTIIALIASLFAAGLMTGITVTGDTAFAQGKAKGKAQTICPIQGGEIDKSLYVDYQGKRIYFCCRGCPEEFMKEPEKYMRRFREAGTVLEKSPKGAGGAHKGHKHH